MPARSVELLDRLWEEYDRSTQDSPFRFGEWVARQAEAGHAEAQEYLHGHRADRDEPEAATTTATNLFE